MEIFKLIGFSAASLVVIISLFILTFENDKKFIRYLQDLAIPKSSGYRRYGYGEYEIPINIIYYGLGVGIVFHAFGLSIFLGIISGVAFWALALMGLAWLGRN